MTTKLLRTALAAVIVAIFAVFTSCTTGDNPITGKITPPSQEQADYTVIFYGQGGGDLDLNILSNIRQFYEADPASFKKVNVVVSYKFSAADNLSKVLSGYVAETSFSQEEADKIVALGGRTSRFVIDPMKKEENQIEEGIYGQPNSDFTHPDSLTNFINWAAKNCPAKNYILVLNGHGDGYMPHENLPLAAATTRGVVFDDGHENRQITLPALTSAISKSSIRPTAIYMDACLMNCAEYMFELKELCDYIVASTYLVPGSGGDYKSLVNELASASGIESALSNFCDASIANWDAIYKDYPGVLDKEGTPVSYYDMKVTRTSNLEAFGANLCEFVDGLLKAQEDLGYDITTPYYKYVIENMREAVKIHHDLCYYDLILYAEIMSTVLPDYIPAQLMEKLRASYDACIVRQCNSDYLSKWDCRVGYSVLIGLEGEYTVGHSEISEISGLPYSPEVVSYYWKGKTQTNFFSDDPNIIWPIAEPEYGNWGSTGADTYEQLVFDRLVGWSRWIKVNCFTPATGALGSLSFTSDYESVELFMGKFEWNGGLKRKNTSK